MSKSKQSIKLPKLPAEQIRRYKQAGRWPPPDGIIVLPEVQPSEDGVASLFESLAQILPPQKRSVVEKVKEKSKKD